MHTSGYVYIYVPTFMQQSLLGVLDIHTYNMHTFIHTGKSVLWVLEGWEEVACEGSLSLSLSLSLALSPRPPPPPSETARSTVMRKFLNKITRP